ncbi:MAG TPA: NAD(P)H-binding protein [Flavisolibacter sp.]|nr:NAD(P)H-binding protein [Flavisolibacter sp.]
MKNKTAVLGATGKTGRRIAQRLTSMNIPFRAGSRKADIPFDWNDPTGWPPFFNGIEKVYISFQPDLAVPGAEEAISNLVAVAKGEGVQHLVLLSGRGEPEAQACEKLLMQSGLQWTVIRASWFMENFSEGFFLDGIQAGHLVLPKVMAREPFVSADDIADVAVKVLTEEGHNEKIYELTGPDLLSFEKVVTQIAQATERPIGFEEIAMNDYVAMLRNYGVPEDFIGLVRYLFTDVLDGRNESLTGDVESVLGRKPTTIGEYVAKTNSSGAWG